MVGHRLLPTGCRDWHPDLIKFAQSQYNIRLLTHKNNYAAWMIARDLLKASQSPIYKQLTGEDKGIVMGIPDQIGDKIKQVLLEIVRSGVIPVNPDEGHADMHIEDSPLYYKRNYQDSTYAVLASMYTQLQPDRYKQITTSEVQEGMKDHCQYAVTDNFRTGEKGAFRAAKELLIWHVLLLHTPGGNRKNYTLTESGLRLCYHLFHVKFDPSASAAYKLVRPRADCVATAEGNVVPIRAGNTTNNTNTAIRTTNNTTNGPANPSTNNRASAGSSSTTGNKRTREHGDFNENSVIEIDDEEEGVHTKRQKPGSSSTGSAEPPAVPIMNEKTDSQLAAELEEAQVQSLLAYSEQQARLHSEERRARERMEEEHALQLVYVAQEECEVSLPGEQKGGSGNGRGGSGKMVSCDSSGSGSDVDTDDEDFKRALAESLRYAGGSGGACVGGGVSSGSVDRNISATARDSPSRAALPLRTPAVELTSPGEVVFVDTPLKATASSNTTSNSRSAAATAITHSHTNATARTPVREYINLDDSQEEESQEVVYSAHSITNSVKPAATTTVTSSVTRAHRTPLPATHEVVEIDDSQPPDTDLGDAPPSTPRIHTLTHDKDVMELDTTPSPAKPCTLRTALPTAPLTTLPAASVPYTQEVINLDDSQSQPQYDESEYIDIDLSNTHNTSIMDVVDVHESQEDDVVYVPGPAARSSAYTNKSGTSGSSGSGAVASANKSTGGAGSGRAKASAILAAYDNRASSTLNASSTRTTGTTSTSASTSTTNAPTWGQAGTVTTTTANAAITLTNPTSSAVPTTTTIPSTTTSTTTTIPSTTTTLPPLPSLTTTLYPQPHPIATTTVPFTAQHKVALLLDIRERATQKYYREFLFDIQKKCTAHFSNGDSGVSSDSSVEWSAEQQKLVIGDIAFAYEHNTTTPATAEATATHYLTGVIIERKATKDLIGSSAGDSRARCGTARHIVQESRLRHVSSVYCSGGGGSGSASSGGNTRDGSNSTNASNSSTSANRSNCFMLIEGNITTATLHAAPLTHRDSDLLHPDVIDSTEGILGYMCSVLARNSARNRVRVLQTVNNSATCLMVAAMLAVEVHGAEQSNSVYINNLINNNTLYTNTSNTNRNTSTTAPSTTTTSFTTTSATTSTPNSTNPTNTTSTPRLALPTKSSMDKYCRSFGASMQGKEAALRKALAVPVLVPATGVSGHGSTNSAVVSCGNSEASHQVVSAEMVERIVRRFGCWDALLHMYKQCYSAHVGGGGGVGICSSGVGGGVNGVNGGGVGSTSYGVDVDSSVVSSAEARCALMLYELTVGGTQSERDTITANDSNTTRTDIAYTLDDSQDSMDTPTAINSGSTASNSASVGGVLLRDSLLVWQHARTLLIKEGFLHYSNNSTSANSTNSTGGGGGSSSSSSSNGISPAFTRYFHSLHTTLLPAKPRKVTHVTMSTSMSEGVMAHYASLGSANFVCTILPTTGTSNTTITSTTTKRRKADTTIGGNITHLNCADGNYPFLCIQSVDHNTYKVSNSSTYTGTANTTTLRCSLRTVVAVVAAVDVVEALVFATQAYKQHNAPPGGSGGSGGGGVWGSVSVFADSGRCVDIVISAAALILPRLPAEFNTTGTSTDNTTPATTSTTSTNTTNTSSTSSTATTAPAQCVLVVEGLVHPTSPAATAAGKLQSALNSSSGSVGTSGGVSMGVGRPLLPVVEAREVSANHLWLVQMFIAVVSMRGSGGTCPVRSSSSGGTSSSNDGSCESVAGVPGWQCFTSYSADQTERLLYSLIHETHRQSLMLY